MDGSLLAEVVVLFSLGFRMCISKYDMPDLHVDYMQNTDLAPNIIRSLPYDFKKKSQTRSILAGYSKYFFTNVR